MLNFFIAAIFLALKFRWNFELFGCRSRCQKMGV